MPVDAAAAKAIFLAALDRPDQSAFVDSACSGDPELRARVQALLDAHAAGSFPDYLGAGDDTRTAPLTPDDPTRTGGAAPDPSGPALDFLQPPREPGHPGRLDHYEILSVLGQGGMGIVLKAHDESLDRTVAIKVLAPQFAANPSARKRFIREAKAVAAVVHEHVVAVHAVDERVPYLVMQFVSGVSLQERLDRAGPLPLAEVLRIGMQIAAGLAAAHKQGIVHRDIKPSNILLENGVERVKISDFGLARAVDDASVTQSGVIAGTPLYMSPEQARGEAVDPRSDLFSLGSVLYAMCTGHAPFRASGTMAVLKRVIEDRPRPVRDANPDVPGWLEAIILTLLAKDPADRFQSARDVAQLLEQHLAHLRQPDRVPRPAPVRRAEPTRPKKAKSSARTLILVLVLVFGGMLAVCVVAVPLLWLFWGYGPEPARATGREVMSIGPDPVGKGMVLDPVDDEQRFRGAWRGVAGQFKGKELSDDELNRTRLTVTGDRARLAVPPLGAEVANSITLDPTIVPKQITIGAGAGGRGVLEGIYRFDGDRLLLCVAAHPGPRPTAFATQADTSDILLTLERAAVAPFALDPSQGPGQMIGGWSVRTTVTSEETFPNAVMVPGQVTVEPVAGGKFVRYRLKSPMPGPDELMVIGYNPPRGEFTSHVFDTRGRAGRPGVGRMDAESRTLSVVAQPEDGVALVQNVHFLDRDTITSERVARGRDGKIVSDMKARMTRDPKVTAIREDPDGDRPAEMAALDRLLGTWGAEAASKVRPGEKWRVEMTCAKALAGRVVEIRERVKSTGEEHYMVCTFDPKGKAFRQWYFSSRWAPAEGTGTWDAGSKTMSWSSGGGDQTTTTTWKFATADRIEFRVVLKDGKGKVLEDLEGTHTRRKGPG
jgi:uncharacterized protein (TIGR03067 family)